MVVTASVSRTNMDVGQTVRITDTTKQGSGSYQYAMAYKLSSASSYTTARGFSTTKTATLKFSKAGTYNVRVAVKDSNNYTVYKYMTVTVTK